MPNAELPVVGESVTEVTPVVGGTRERHRLMLSLSIDNGFYTVTKGACCGIEIDATEVIAY